MSLRFEWDSKKAQSNRRRHPAHSISEDRFITIGTSVNDKLIVVVHTDRNDIIRIISARKATKNERRQYEQG